MDCPNLVEAFEKEHVQKPKQSLGQHKKRKSIAKQGKRQQVMSEAECEMNRGFSRGYEPERILGATDVGPNGQIMFLMKWKDVQVSDLVYAETAKVKCPQTVIAFYEQALRWPSAENCDSVSLASI